MINNMRFISKALIFTSSMLVLLSATIYADENNIKSATFISEKFEVGAGRVGNKMIWNVEFPRGHVGIKSFDAEIVDENGNSVPLYEAYLHHVFVQKYHEKIRTQSPTRDQNNTSDGLKIIRNDGVCPLYILDFFWGLGIESRGPGNKIPNPYAVEIGNPEKIESGFEEKWFFNVMVIDLRGTKDSKGCTECRCDHYNLPSNHFNVTKGTDGEPLSPDYKGGVICCKNNAQCTLKEGFQATNRTLAIRYKITWVDWNPHKIPVRFYILDVTDRVRTNDSKLIHDCQVEYSIPPSTSLNPSPHIKRAYIPMEKGGYLIHTSAHLHTGGLDASLYGQDGKLLCNTTAKYGTGKEPGNEEGYVVGMLGCSQKPSSVKIENGETVKVEVRYKGEFLTGAMGHMYIWLADKLPKDIHTTQKVVKAKSNPSNSTILARNHTPKNRSLQKKKQHRKTGINHKNCKTSEVA